MHAFIQTVNSERNRINIYHSNLSACTHGGTQVVGTTNRNDIFNGLPYGQRQVNVALLDQVVICITHQSHNRFRKLSVHNRWLLNTSGNYQSPTGNTNQSSPPSDQNNNTYSYFISPDGRVLIDQLNENSDTEI